MKVRRSATAGVRIGGRPAWAVLVPAILAACTDGVTPSSLLAPTEGALGSSSPAPPANVRIVASVATIQGPDWSAPVGSVHQFTARVVDAQNRPVTGRTVRWVSERPTIATMDSTGRMHVLAVGFALVGADLDGQRVRMQFKIVPGPNGITSVAGGAPTTAPAGAPAPQPVDGGAQTTTTAPGAAPFWGPRDTTGTLALTVSRFDGAAGGVLVSNGVPLAPGTVRPDALPRMRLLVAGGANARTGGALAEVPVAITPLAGRHPDGSLRSVLVQFRLAALGAADRVPASLVLGNRGGAPRAPGFTTTPAALGVPAAGVGVPDAAALPTDADYLVRTDIVGPTVTTAAASRLGEPFASYETRFARAAERHWTVSGTTWEHYYYDRAMVFYAAWARSGNPVFWHRATRMAVAYRRDYVEANRYGVSAHWSFVEGLGRHYLLTGDEASRVAVAQMATTLGGFQPRLSDPQSVDARVYGRVVQSALTAWQLGQGVPYPAAAGSAGTTAWASRLDDALTRLASYQTADGRYPTFLSTCGGQQAFMAGILNDALVATYRTYRADARAVTAIRRSADFLWSTQWLPASRSFRNADTGCAGQNAAEPTPDLSGLSVTPFGFLARVTGDAKYRAAGDQIFAGMAGAWIDGTKQFNQSYVSSFRYLGER